MHCNPDGSASDGFSGRVCGPAEARTSRPRAQGPWLLGQGGREGTPKGSTPPHAADARDAGRGLLYQAAQMQASRRGPSVGRPLVSAFHSGTAIGQVAADACTVGAHIQNDPDDISHAGAGADADADSH